jgi:hypothetical protein
MSLTGRRCAMASPPLQYNVRSALTELTLARIRELTREPEASSGSSSFRSCSAAILSLAFRSRPPDPLPVGVVDGRRRRHAWRRFRDERLRPRLLASEEAAQALARVMWLPSYSERTPDYTYDPTQPDSRTAFLLVDCRAAARRGTHGCRSRQRGRDHQAGRPLR